MASAQMEPWQRFKGGSLSAGPLHGRNLHAEAGSAGEADARVGGDVRCCERCSEPVACCHSKWHRRCTLEHLLSLFP